jgi:hypothetical protein
MSKYLGYIGNFDIIKVSINGGGYQIFDSISLHRLTKDGKTELIIDLKNDNEIKKSKSPPMRKFEYWYGGK